MARVTVEDCMVKIPNRFELALLAAQRARALAGGGTLTVERDNDKNPVVALREIAEGTIDPGSLHDDLIRGLQKHIEVDEPVEDADQLALEEGIATLEGAGASAEPEPEPEPDEVSEEGDDLEAIVDSDIAGEMEEPVAPERERG